MGDLSVRGSAPTPPPLPTQSVDKTAETKPTSQTQAPAQNTQSLPKKVEVNKEGAAQKKNEQSVTGSIKKKELDQQLSAKKTESTNAAQQAEASQPLPKQARVRNTGMTAAEYDFGRPITREQAAKVIFKDGTVPEGAKLTQGPGPNSWTLKSTDFETHEGTLRKMRPRYETTQADGSVIAEWAEISTPASEVSAYKRWDKNNDFGFKITGKYALDEGQQQVKYVNAGHGTGKGKGFVLEFEKPMTKDQVMDKLFDKSKLPSGAVKLIAVPHEPSTTWRAEIIGAEADAAYKPRITRAFGSASTANDNEIVRPGIPAGIQKHFQNKTVPDNATKHPPNVYVWEQEGHLVRVEKGNNGYYSHEVTQLHPSDKPGNDTIRYFIKDKGMKSRDAWQAYVKHWDDIHKGIITAYAISLSGGRMPGKAPAGNVATRRPVVKNTEPPANRPNPEPIPVKTNGTTLNTKAPTVNTNVKPNQKAPVDPRAKTAVDPHAKTQPAGVNTNGTTVDGNTVPKPAPPKVRPMVPRKALPEHQQITINTADGPKKMTVGEYRRQYKLAEKWRQDQIIFNKRNPYDMNLDQEAAKKFGLDKGWQKLNNPYVQGVAI